MKLNLSRKGFTLVEIMIVVVIIGLLAALAIPAFKKVRNTAVEKTIFNDARQLSSAANQYFTENSTNTTTVSTLIGPSSYLASLSAGTLISQSFVPGVNNANTVWTTSGRLALINVGTEQATVPANSVITLGNIGYDTSLSSLANVTGVAPKGGYTTSSPGDNSLIFSVETGQLLRRTATLASNGAIY